VKQVFLLGIVAFAFAIGGATWVSAYLLPPPPAPVVDSTANGATASGATVAPTTARARSAPSDTGPPKAGVPDTSSAAAAAPKVAPAPTRDSMPPNVKTVAKIMVAMKPKDAVSIMARLSDKEVEQILRQMNAKQVAALLAVLPQERAAELSRRLLLDSPPVKNGATP
jgi:MgtE intracellular N domain